MYRLITSVRNFARDSVALGWRVGMFFNNVRDIRKAAACALDEVELGLVWSFVNRSGGDSLPIGICTSICVKLWPAFTISCFGGLCAALATRLVLSSLASGYRNSDLIINLLGRQNGGRIVKGSLARRGGLL